MKQISRLDESLFARWWWSVDRPSLAILALIMMIGAVLIIAAGPPAAMRMRIAEEFHFPIRQFVCSWGRRS